MAITIFYAFLTFVYLMAYCLFSIQDLGNLIKYSVFFLIERKKSLTLLFDFVTSFIVNNSYN